MASISKGITIIPRGHIVAQPPIFHLPAEILSQILEYVLPCADREDHVNCPYSSVEYDDFPQHHGRHFRRNRPPLAKGRSPAILRVCKRFNVLGRPLMSLKLGSILYANVSLDFPVTFRMEHLNRKKPRRQSPVSLPLRRYKYLQLWVCFCGWRRSQMRRMPDAKIDTMHDELKALFRNVGTIDNLEMYRGSRRARLGAGGYRYAPSDRDVSIMEAIEEHWKAIGHSDEPKL